MDCSPPDSVHGISQARILEQVAIPFSRGSSRPRDWNLGVSHCRQILHCPSHQGSQSVRDLGKLPVAPGAPCPSSRSFLLFSRMSVAVAAWPFTETGDRGARWQLLPMSGGACEGGGGCEVARVGEGMVIPCFPGVWCAQVSGPRQERGQPGTPDWQPPRLLLWRPGAVSRDRHRRPDPGLLRGTWAPPPGLSGGELPGRCWGLLLVCCLDAGRVLWASAPSLPCRNSGASLWLRSSTCAAGTGSESSRATRTPRSRTWWVEATSEPQPPAAGADPSWASCCLPTGEWQLLGFFCIKLTTKWFRW